MSDIRMNRLQWAVQIGGVASALLALLGLATRSALVAMPAFGAAVVLGFYSYFKRIRPGRLAGLVVFLVGLVGMCLTPYLIIGPN